MRATTGRQNKEIRNRRSDTQKLLEMLTTPKAMQVQQRKLRREKLTIDKTRNNRWKQNLSIRKEHAVNLSGHLIYVIYAMNMMLQA